MPRKDQKHRTAVERDGQRQQRDQIVQPGMAAMGAGPLPGIHALTALVAFPRGGFPGH